MPVKKPSACCIPKGRNAAGAFDSVDLAEFPAIHRNIAVEYKIEVCFAGETGNSRRDLLHRAACRDLNVCDRCAGCTAGADLDDAAALCGSLDSDRRCGFAVNAGHAEPVAFFCGNGRVSAAFAARTVVNGSSDLIWETPVLVPLTCCIVPSEFMVILSICVLL